MHSGRHRADPVAGDVEPEPFVSVGLTPVRRGRRAVLAALADRLPESVRTARVGSGRRAVAGLLIIVVATVGVLGARLAMASAAARPEVVAPRSAEPSPPATATPAGSTPTSSTAATAATSAPVLLVDVAGRVRRPGVVRLPAGARVQDALRAAGGSMPGSDLVGLNLAQPLVDGQQVVVARTGSALNGGSAPGGGVSGTGTGAGGSISVALNSADLAALDSLPGVGPVLAQRILDWRTAHGRFSSVDELDEVSGIGDKLMAQIRPHVRL